jgi:hypothetical protein
MVKRKHKIFKKYRRNDHPVCKTASKAAAAEVRKAKLDFEKKLADNIKVDNKSFYAYVRRKSKVKVKPGPLIDDSGKILESPQEMAEEFNSYFSSVVTKEDLDSIPQAPPVFSGPNDAAELHITDEMIRAKLRKLRADKAPGDDGISSRLLRGLQEELVIPLR